METNNLLERLQKITLMARVQEIEHYIEDIMFIYAKRGNDSCYVDITEFINKYYLNEEEIELVFNEIIDYFYNKGLDVIDADLKYENITSFSWKKKLVKNNYFRYNNSINKNYEDDEENEKDL